MNLALAALGGLVAGCFLNVIAFRLAHGQSLRASVSYCPGCRITIRPYGYLAVSSGRLLRARCRSCGTELSTRYPLVEPATGALAAAIVAVQGLDADAVLPLMLVAVLVPVALIDLDERVIPNRITAPGAMAAIALGSLADADGEPERLIAGVGAGGFLLLAALAYPDGMGMGDVKLACVLGLSLGREVAVALLVAFLVGTLVGVLVLAREGVRKGRKTAVPFGPFLALGGLVAALAGGPLMDAYTSTFWDAHPSRRGPMTQDTARAPATPRMPGG